MSDYLPEWLTQGMKENNVSINDLRLYLIDINNAMENEEYQRRLKEYGNYIGKYYREAYEYDTNGEPISYYYYNILGFNRHYEPRYIFDVLSFMCEPESTINEGKLSLDGIISLDTIGAYCLSSLEEISEEEYKEALYKHVDSLLDMSQIEETYKAIDEYLGRI